MALRFTAGVFHPPAAGPSRPGGPHLRPVMRRQCVHTQNSTMKPEFKPDEMFW